MALKGAILGDIIGSVFEFRSVKDYDYKTVKLLTDKNHFTDDTVLLLATKHALHNNIAFADAYHAFGNKYIDAGYGSMFEDWLMSDNKEPYGSYGNGSAMRVAYIADFFDDIFDAQQYAAMSASCTHNHAEGIKGAIVTATCIWMAKHNYSKDDILAYAIACYPTDKYALSPFMTLDVIRERCDFNESCQACVPVAIRCAYEANSFEEFMRNVLSLNCDTDTIGAIGGGIAEELFKNNDDPLLNNIDDTLEQYLDEYLLSVLKSKEDFLSAKA